MKKVLLSAVALAMTATAANAASINLRHEYKPAFGDQKSTYADRIEVTHNFANGIGFLVELKYADEDSKSNGNNDMVQNNHVAAIKYSYKINDSFTLTPQYKIEGSTNQAAAYDIKGKDGETTLKDEDGKDIAGTAKAYGDLTHQFNLTLGYKVNDEWSVSYRQRYNQANHEDYYHQGTFAFGYSGIQDWGIGGSADYRVTGGDIGKNKDVWDDNNKGFSEINFKAQYNGLESGWKPFGEFGVTPSKKDSTDNNENWRPRLRVGVAYNF